MSRLAFAAQKSAKRAEAVRQDNEATKFWTLAFLGSGRTPADSIRNAHGEPWRTELDVWQGEGGSPAHPGGWGSFAVDYDREDDVFR